MPETTPLIKAALNLRVGAGFDVYDYLALTLQKIFCVVCVCAPQKESKKTCLSADLLSIIIFSVLHHQQAFMIYFIINKFRPFLNSIMVDKILVHYQCLG